MVDIDRLVEQLTLEEKASLMSGADYWHTVAIERLGIPSLMMSDGPHGLRKQAKKTDPLGIHKSVPATCFPTASILACSWDTTLVENVGAAIAREAAAEDVGMLLGPGLNIIRDPLSGRAFEYFSEDPYVAGKLAAGMIRGIESEGVIATPKHFAVNSQEHLRMTIDEVVDERTLHELYLEGFRYAITEGLPRAIMTSYNRVNGTYANEHTHLLRDTLQDEWGFDGLIVTDWGGNHDRVNGLVAGNQLEMPGNHGVTNREIIAAVRSGKLDEAILDERVKSFLRVVFGAQPRASHISVDAQHALAIDAAAQSMVLLKNDRGILPLRPKQKIALIGDFAAAPRYQGSGSSLVNPTKLPTLKDVLQDTNEVTLVGFARGFKRRGGANARLLNEAKHLVNSADCVLICIGLDEAKEAEGIDRSDMQLSQNQVRLVHEIAASHPNVIVVYSGGGPVEMPFAGDVAAIIHAGLAGQGGAEALAKILTGQCNPSGKLAQTWPIKHVDTPAAHYFPGPENSAEHREGLFVGYRFYDTVHMPVLFPFGHGLSYTTFEYSQLTVSETSVSFTLKNNGAYSGDEISQVYIQPPRTGIFRPVHELKGFARTTLDPGQSKRVTIQLDEHAFMYFDTVRHAWCREAGVYDIQIGASSRDSKLQAQHTLTGESSVTYDQSLLEPYFSGRVQRVSDASFEELLGHVPPPHRWADTKILTIDDTIAQLRYRHGPTRFTYDVLRFVRWTLMKCHQPQLANNLMFVINMPFSKIPSFTGGIISRGMVKRVFGLRDKK